MKILVLQGDDLITGKEIDDNKFVFIILESGVYYTNTSYPGQPLWRTDKHEIANGTDKLGDGHRKLIKEALGMES